MRQAGHKPGNKPLHYTAAAGRINPTGRPARQKAGEREIEVARISLDNGNTYMTAQETMPEITDNNLWDAVVNMMDDDTREAVHTAIAPCTEVEFLTAYLERATDDLIIG